MKDSKIINLYKNFVLPVYKRSPYAFVKGRGSILYSQEGQPYIDLFPGWGTGILGHAHPLLAKRICSQARTLIHIPNNLYHPWQGELAKKIIEKSFRRGKVFFCNSGAEAVEASLKLIRAYSQGKGSILSMKNSFHGRTVGALSLTGQKKYQQGLGPLLRGVQYARFSDIEDVKKKITPRTKGIIVEVIQGEGGVNMPSPDFLRELRALCNTKGIVLVFDEIQTGIGRTGRWFAYQNYGVEPDLLCLSKGLGGGFPIGCLVVKDRFKDILKPGMHASTFGGSPLACVCGLEVFKIIEREKLLSRVRRLGSRIFSLLEMWRKTFRVIKNVRGVGFMIGIELKDEGYKLIEEAFRRKLIINCTQARILRIMPALNIPENLLFRALGILEECFKKVYG